MQPADPAVDASGPAERVPLHRSVATRSFLAIAAVLVLLTGAILALAVLRDFENERDALEARALAQANFMATVSPEPMFLRDFLTLETLARQAVEDDITIHAVFIDNSGDPMTRFVRSDDPLIEQVVERSGVTASIQIADQLANEPAIEEIRLPVISEGVQLGEIRLVYTVEQARANARAFAAGAVVVTLLFAGAMVGLTLLVFRRQLRRPLHELTRKTQSVASGDFSDIAATERRDEIGELQRAFNRMAAELETTLTGLERARDDAERADRAKSEFLANMSHEIRTPLNAVLGINELLLESGVDDEQRELLETMHHSGDALLEILNEVLDYSKLESRELEIDNEPFELAQVIESTAELFGPAAAQKGVTLAVSAAPELPRTVMGDGGRIRQILVNLVGNAVKFTDRGFVRLAVVPDPTSGDDHIAFAVEDSGIGIDPERGEHLFEPFEQGDTTTTRRFGGTGLGLTICHRLVTAMGGTIGVTGQLGVGSTFRFSVPLPVAPDDDAPTADAMDANERLGAEHPLHILVAEDNAVNQIVIRRMFERLGYEIDVVGDGVSAVEAALGAAYDLILMDIQMPRLDGHEAARRIRSLDAPGASPRIFATTARVDGDGEVDRAAGMDGRITKPIRLADLVDVVRATPRRSSGG